MGVHGAFPESAWVPVPWVHTPQWVPVLCPLGRPPGLAHDGHRMRGEGSQPLTVFLNNDPKEIFLKSCVVLGNSSELLTIRQPCYIS